MMNQLDLPSMAVEPTGFGRHGYRNQAESERSGDRLPLAARRVSEANQKESSCGVTLSDVLSSSNMERAWTAAVRSTSKIAKPNRRAAKRINRSNPIKERQASMAWKSGAFPILPKNIGKGYCRNWRMAHIVRRPCAVSKSQKVVENIAILELPTVEELLKWSAVSLRSDGVGSSDSASDQPSADTPI